MRGRPAKPSVIRQIEGERRHIRKDRRKADLQVSGMPMPNCDLLPVEKQLFEKICDAMPEGLLGRIDSHLVERYVSFCVLFNEVREQARIKSPGSASKYRHTVHSPRGEHVNPALTLMLNLSKEIRQLSSELGASPSSRAKLGKGLDKEVDVLDMLLDVDAAEWEVRATTKKEPELKPVPQTHTKAS